MTPLVQWLAGLYATLTVAAIIATISTAWKQGNKIATLEAQIAEHQRNHKETHDFVQRLQDCIRELELQITRLETISDHKK